MADPWEAALEEAYASAPADEVILCTLEFTHSSFVDDEDNLVPIRVVDDFGTLQSESGTPLGMLLALTTETQLDYDIYGHMLTLEDDAVYNPAESVLFQSMAFELSLPEQDESSFGSMTIRLDNVTKQISQYLDNAVVQRESIKVVYREYLASDPTTPQLIMDGFEIKRVKSNILDVRMVAEFNDLGSKSFPNKVYRLQEFPGLAP